jgi:hypothetical protein
MPTPIMKYICRGLHMITSSSTPAVQQQHQQLASVGPKQTWVEHGKPMSWSCDSFKQQADKGHALQGSTLC